MKKIHISILMIILILICIVTGIYIILFSDTKNKLSLNHGKKWKIAYYEGGFHRNYVLTLLGFLEGLSDKKIIKNFDKTKIPNEVFDNNNSNLFWKWIIENVKSDHIEFTSYWSAGWLNSLRIENKDAVKSSWKIKSFDVILTMGTAGGQDLVNMNNKFPIILLAITDPVESLILKSDNNYGYDNIFTIYDPERIENLIKISKELFQFKNLGVIYLDNETSLSASGMSTIDNLSKYYNFEIKSCSISTLMVDQKIIVKDTINCIHSLIKKNNMDLFLFTSMVGYTSESITLIVNELNEHKYPSISVDSLMVKYGVLLSYGMKSNFNEEIGKLGSEAFIQICNGIKPSSIKNMYYKIPRGLIVNQKTLKELILKIPESFIYSAVEIY